MAIRRLAVLVSGGGTNLQAILDAVAKKEIPQTEVSLVVSNRTGAYALERARRDRAETLVLDPKDFSSRSLWCAKMVQELKRRRVDLVCCAGFLLKLESCMIRAFPQRILNIHPSLLPKFGGPGMYGIKVHQAVLEAGEKETGVTVHFVDEEYDRGPIVLQEKIPVLSKDTPETLAQRVLELEHKVYPQAIQKALNQLK